MAHSELLEYDFPILHLAGEYWKKGKLPKDEYYYSDFIGVRPILLYPINIIISILMASTSLNIGFCILVYSVLIHNLSTSIFAYFFFGKGLIGLFGTLAWAYIGYHQHQSITRTAGFCWLTATLLCLKLHHPILAGISLGMMILSTNTPYVLYFIYCLSIYYTFKLFL